MPLGFEDALERMLAEIHELRKKKIPADVTFLLRWDKDTGQEQHRAISRKHTL